MGALSTIGFTPGRSILHRLDPRTKQALLMLLSAACLWGQGPFLALLSTMIGLGLVLAGVSCLSLIRDIRYFLFLLAVIFGLRAISFGNGWIPLIDPVTAGEALIVCWRLLLMVLMGLLVMATTSIAQLRAALTWFLGPVPGIDARMVATMVGLLVRFLPLILLQAAEISEAQRARGVDRRKNPARRLMLFSTALFRRVFLGADELVVAMQARCYTHDRTLPALGFSRRDSMALAVGIGLLVISIAW